MTRKVKEKKAIDQKAKKAVNKTLIMTAGALGAVVVGITFLVTNSGHASTISPEDQLINRILSPPTAYALALGNSSAKITIVEFGDYQCNSCTRFHRDSQAQVVSDLVNTGKAKFMFKDFVINDVILKPPNASTLAAEAAYCAGDQGKYWQYHDELYNNQQPEGVVWVSEDALKHFAANVGVNDMNAFTQCLDSHRYTQVVKDNTNLAATLGLNATPTFLIIKDGQKPEELVGAYPAAAFDQVVGNLQKG